MAIETLEPLIIRVFGGLCTFIDRLSLGLGLSPNCKNVRFSPGTVGSRDGYQLFTQYGGTSVSAASAIYSFKSFISRNGYKRILYLTAGSLLCRQHYPASTTTLLTGLGSSEPLTMRGDALFGKLYLAIQAGGGTAFPFAVPKNGKTRLLATDGSTIRDIAPDAPAWTTYLVPGPLYSSVDASVGTGGLSAGLHMFVWLFLMDDGYITRPGNGGTFTATGANTYVTATNAPIGPPRTLARILAITPVDDTNFYYIPTKTVIWDNTTKNFTQKVPEAELLAGEPIRPYFSLYTPSAPDGVIAYSDRLVLWGCVEKSEPSNVVYPSYQFRGLANLAFNGGFQTASNLYYSAPWALPARWQSAGTFAGFGPGANGDTLKITGAAVAGVDSAYVTGPFDESYMRPGQNITMRVRSRWSGLLATGQIRVTLTVLDTSGATVLTVPLNLSVTTEWEINTTAGGYVLPSLGAPPLTGATVTITVAPIVTLPNATDWVEIDWIEIIDLNDTSHQNLLRVSRAGEPESFDIETGYISVGPDDGEGIRNCFRLRDALYICKERSLYVTKDIGEEPASWPVDLVDRMAGTPSPHGVASGDGWVVIASRSGLVLFDGSTPQIISQEITPTWDTIDWTDPNMVWVVADPSRKQIKVGAKTSGVANTLLLTLDYVEGFGNPIPSGQGRKWSIDSVLSSKAGTYPYYHYGEMVIDIYGTPRPVYSMTATPHTGTEMNVLTYQDDSGGATDTTRWNDFPDSQVAGQGYIDAIYETAPLGPEVGRALFDRVVERIRGNGYIETYYIKPDGTAVRCGPPSPATAPAMTSTPEHDIEVGSNTHGTALGVRLQTASRTNWFSIRRMAVWLKNAAYGLMRGYNS